MRVLVTGATGRVGSELARQALTRGDTVIALARHPETLSLRDAHLRCVAADVRDPDAVVPLLEGVDAVIHAVGIGTSRKPTTVYSDGARALISGMEEHGVHCLVVISSQAANAPDRQTWPQRLALRHALSLFFGATYDDMRRMDQVLRESSVDWTQVRAPYISGKPAKGSYRFSIDRQPSCYRSITASDMATALLDTADRTDLARKDVFAGN